MAKMPISKAAKKQFVRLLTTKEDQIPHIKAKDKTQYLSSISYREFLTKHLNITEPDVFVYQDLVVDCGLGIEARMPTWHLSILVYPVLRGRT